MGIYIPLYDDLWVELDKNTVINMGLVSLSPWEWLKVSRVAAK